MLCVQCILVLRIQYYAYCAVSYTRWFIILHPCNSWMLVANIQLSRSNHIYFSFIFSLTCLFEQIDKPVVESSNEIVVLLAAKFIDFRYSVLHDIGHTFNLFLSTEHIHISITSLSIGHVSFLFIYSRKEKAIWSVFSSPHSPLLITHTSPLLFTKGYYAHLNPPTMTKKIRTQIYLLIS